MDINFYIPLPFFLLLSLALGFWLGCLFIRYLNKPKEIIDYYDGKHGMGYQPLANQGQFPKPPQSEMPPLKMPKKGGEFRKPPKPPHNPHK